MRVTQNTTANLVMQNLQTILQRQADLEQQASTGLKVSQPGDDPVSAQQILSMKSLNASRDQYSRNIINGTSVLSMSDSAMSGINDALVRTKEIALSMATGTTTADSRTAAASELKQLQAQVIALGNTQLNGKYIFGGFKNDTPPFDVSGNYTGTGDDIKTEVDQGTYVTVNYTGDKLIAGGTPPGSSGTDMMGMFNSMITALNAGNPSGVQAQLSTLDKAMSQVNAARSVVGASINRLNASSSLSDDMKLATTKVLAGIQDVDYMQVVSDLTKQQTAYQTAIAASAKVSQISLLDYLK